MPTPLMILFFAISVVIALFVELRMGASDGVGFWVGVGLLFGFGFGYYGLSPWIRRQLAEPRHRRRFLNEYEPGALSRSDNTDTVVDLRCRSCGRRRLRASAHSNSTIATCTVCRAVFPAPLDGIGEAARIARPDGLHVEDGDGKLVGCVDGRTYRVSTGEPDRFFSVSRRWWRWNPRGIDLLVFVFVCVAPFAAVYAGVVDEGQWEAITLASIVCVPLVLLPAYYLVARAVNRTRITVDADAISIEHGPLPWRCRKQRYSRPAIRQLVAVEYRIGDDPPERAYRVEAQLAPSRRITLLDGLETAHTALYIEQLIEDVLGIEDRSSLGEIRKNRDPVNRR